jgi:site-specific recombinase XerD
MRLAGLWQDHGLVFCSTVGTPLSRHNIYNRSFKPLLERAGLPRTFRFQDLRHTFATLMASSGGHAKVVQEMLGHATTSITLDLYSHVLPDLQEDAVDRLGALLS